MRRLILASLLLLSHAHAASALDFSYILSTGEGHPVISGLMDFRFLKNVKGDWGDRFLWVNMKGKQYLILDAATLAEARQAWAPADALHVECQRLDARMDPVEDRERELERKIDRIGDDLSDRDDLSRAERARMEQQLEELERQMEPVRRELEQLEQEEERLDQREEVLERAAEVKLRQIIERAIARGAAQRLP